jgi:hypothetical protein
LRPHVWRGYVVAEEVNVSAFSDETRERVDVGWGMNVYAQEAAVITQSSRQRVAEQIVASGPVGNACLEELCFCELGLEFRLDA